MKKLLLSVFGICFGMLSFAQTDVTLKINHKLGVEDFAYGVVATNNLGHDYKAERLEYYLTQITIVHDGGTETAVPLDVMALVQPGEELSTSIPLGNYTVTEIESVKFYIGVFEPENNADPSLYPADHPLAPKAPSMHWGWASGYRFIAYEGLGGTDFAQVFQMHGLGNENYFEVSSEVEVTDEGGTLVMSLNGDYVAGLKNLDLTVGTFSHGSIGEAKTVLENWRDFVFGVYYVGVEEESLINWNIYPNPSTGSVSVQVDELNAVKEITVLNPLGEIVQTIAVLGQNQIDLEFNDAGVYIISALNENGETIATDRVVIE